MGTGQDRTLNRTTNLPPTGLHGGYAVLLTRRDRLTGAAADQIDVQARYNKVDVRVRCRMSRGMCKQQSMAELFWGLVGGCQAGSFQLSGDSMEH